MHKDYTFVAFVALLFFPITASAQTAEADLALAIQAVQTSSAQLQRAASSFGGELDVLKKQQAIAGYWHDACQSTPGCDKPKDH